MAVPVVDKEKCTACEQCVESCPTEAITIADNVAVINPETCAECMDCINVCPTEAIAEP